MEGIEISLPSYLLAGGGRAADPIRRVTPCIKANISRIETVRLCCSALREEADDIHAGALAGVSIILSEVVNELDEAAEVLCERLEALGADSSGQQSDAPSPKR